MNFHSVGVLLCCFVQCTVLVEGGIMCYQCDLLPHQRDCDKVVQCGDHEVCYGERRVTTDGIVVFRSGCKSKQACTGLIAPSSNAFGRREESSFTLQKSDTISLDKREDLIPCSQCCNTSYCNRETCDVTVPHFGIRCLSCQYALTPQDCFVSLQCSTDELCYSQTIIHNYEKRYRLGCISKQQCSDSPTVLGRRQTLNNSITEYCGQCCYGENCNRELCSSTGSQAMALNKPPALAECRDNISEVCSKNVHRCSEEDFKFYKCPYTCGTCTGSGSTQVIDHCTNNPCGSHGTCKTVLNTYSCNCLTGYTGLKCETEIDECASSPCLHGGTCKNLVGNYSCSCDHGYTGNRCETELFDCSKTPCLNEGVCIHKNNKYTCNCTSDFIGQRCQTAKCTHRKDHLLYNGHCYFLAHLVKPWDNDICGGHGYYRAIISSDQEHEALASFTRARNISWAWIGGRYQDSSSRYDWISGGDMNEHSDHWEHPPAHHTQRCVTYHVGRWNPQDCNNNYQHLCERPLTSLVNIVGKACPSPDYYQSGNTCYYLLKETKGPWNTNACDSIGMRPVDVTGNREQHAIVHFVRDLKHYKLPVWIGGRYSKERHHYRWYTSTSSKTMDETSTHWKEPDMVHRQGCVDLSGDKWNVADCSHNHAHLCERPIEWH